MEEKGVNPLLNRTKRFFSLDLVISIIIITVVCFFAYIITLFNDSKKETANNGNVPFVRTEYVTNSNKKTKLYHKSEHYVRIKTKRFLNEEEMKEVIDSLNIKHSLVYFHLANLTDDGEEYGMKTGNTIVLFENPATTKAEAVYMVKSRSINGNLQGIRDILKIGINSTNYASVPKTLSLIYSDYGELVKYTIEKPSLNADVKKIEKAISDIQVKVYPMIRKACAKELEQTLWEHDIDVVLENNTTIALTGGFFVKNKNIKDAYENLSPVLKNLRFNRVKFRWSKSSDYVYYDLDTPKDNIVN
jgi:hypothetical protein